MTTDTNKDHERSTSRPLWVVTGAAGFLGNNLVRQLLNEGQQVRAAILEDHTPNALRGLDVEIVQMDVRDLASVKRAFHAPDREVWVVHCAGIVTIASKVSPELYEVNVGGIRNVLSACRDEGVEKLVYVSTVHAMPVVDGVGTELDHASDFKPELLEGAYGPTKATSAALVLEATDLWRVVVFPTGIIGPNDYTDTHMTRVVRDTAAGAMPVTIEGGYDFVDVRDVAAGIISAAEHGRNGRTYLLSGHYIPMKRMTAAIANATGRQAPPALPIWVAQLAAPLAERVSDWRRTTPTLTPDSIRVLGEPARFSSKRARDELGYRPRPFRETLRDTWDWVRHWPTHESNR